MADQNTAAADGNSGGSHYMAAQPIVLQQTDADMWRETAAAAAGHGGIGGPMAMTYTQAAARNNGTAEKLLGRRRIQEESKLLNYLMTDYDRNFILFKKIF